MHARYGLREIEFQAFDSITGWIHEKTGGPNMAHAVMQCLLSVDPTAYITSQLGMGAPIRKVLRRALEARALFTTITKHDLPQKALDMFSSDNVDVLYAVTPSGLKIDAAANEDSWAYNMVLNGSLCPSTREPIIGFGRGRPHYLTRAQERPEILNVPILFKLSDASAAVLTTQLDEPFEVPAEPFNFYETLDFEDLYGIPDDRRFTEVYEMYAAPAPVVPDINGHNGLGLNGLNVLNGPDGLNGLNGLNVLVYEMIHYNNILHHINENENIYD